MFAFFSLTANHASNHGQPYRHLNPMTWRIFIGHISQHSTTIFDFFPSPTNHTIAHTVTARYRSHPIIHPEEALSATATFLFLSSFPLSRLAPQHHHHEPFLLQPRYCNKSHKWMPQESQSSNLYVALALDASLKPAFALLFAPMAELGVGSGSGQNHGIRRVGLRAEIDTSPPFGSVKEAVTRFENTGPSTPLYDFGEPYNSAEDFDIKRVEEEAAKLEKDLIVKELETLDVLEELGATKAILEELKQQLQSEALNCFAAQGVNSCERIGAPVKNCVNDINNEEKTLQCPSRYATSSPNLSLMDLRQAKMSLGKTINDLGVIQSSVEALNKKMKKERLFVERTRQKIALKFAAVSAQEVTKNEAILNPSEATVGKSCTCHHPLNVGRSFEFDTGQCNGMSETRSSEENGFSIKTAEMRWFVAKKMEEAAMAAEAVALAEIKALCSPEISSEFVPLEHQKVPLALAERSPLHPIVQIPQESALMKVMDSKFQVDQIGSSKLSILKKLEEATEEVTRSKQVLAEALNSVENANRKQHAAEEALRRWIPQDDLKGQRVYNYIKPKKFNQAGNCQDSPLPDDVTRLVTVNNDPKPILRSSVSMRDVLSKKQVPEEYTTKEMEEHSGRKVALSQMLQALRENQSLPTIPEKDGSDQRQFIAQRKKFGFIQISLPLRKRSKKKA